MKTRFSISINGPKILFHSCDSCSLCQREKNIWWSFRRVTDQHSFGSSISSHRKQNKEMHFFVFSVLTFHTVFQSVFPSPSSRRIDWLLNVRFCSIHSVKLKHFQKFADTTEALAAATATVEGKVSKTLKKTLKKLIDEDVQNLLAVADAKLGSAIKEKLDLQCVSNSSVQELMRCIRSQSESLLAGLPKKEMSAMALGLAHSLSRYKLKFSPDKIDTMIVQAQCLLDDLDKELNNYLMRAREW